MNAREMHIEVNQSLQKVAANRTRKFLSGEIDLALNKIVGRFIQSKLRPRKDGSGGFDVDQLGLDALRTLIVNKTLDAYYETGSTVISYLPSDYKHLLRDSSTVELLCGQATASTSQETLKIMNLRQPRSGKNTQPYYTSMQVQLGDVTVRIPADLPASNTFNGYEAREDISFLVPFILNRLRANGLEVYWERFAGMYTPSSYFVVGNSDLPEAVNLTIDGTDQTLSSVTTKTLIRYISSSTQTSANRLCAWHTIDALKDAAFFKSSAHSPISELRGDLLVVHHDSSFIVNKTAITYVRKPQTISLLLGTDCDLPEDFHQAICDLTVEYLKGRLGDLQGMQLAESDNERRVTI